jgi:hypothetical protein
VQVFSIFNSSHKKTAQQNNISLHNSQSDTGKGQYLVKTWNPLVGHLIPALQA